MQGKEKLHGCKKKKKNEYSLLAMFGLDEYSPFFFKEREFPSDFSFYR